MAQDKAYLYYKSRLRDLLQDQIRGHEIRTKGQPKYEINDPDISTYSQFEKRYHAQNVIYQLVDDKGDIHSDQDSLITVTDKYYTALFSKSRTNTTK